MCFVSCACGCKWGGVFVGCVVCGGSVCGMCGVCVVYGGGVLYEMYVVCGGCIQERCSVGMHGWGGVRGVVCVHT